MKQVYIVLDISKYGVPYIVEVCAFEEDAKKIVETFKSSCCENCTYEILDLTNCLPY